MGGITTAGGGGLGSGTATVTGERRAVGHRSVPLGRRPVVNIHGNKASAMQPEMEFFNA